MIVWAGVLICACGGGSAEKQGMQTGPQPSASAAPSAAPATTTTAADDTYDDPNESATAIGMEPLVKKGTPKSAYPKAKVDEGACWKTVPFSGAHDKDWTALVGACGTPTGMLEYVKPENGKLHHIKDKVDSFTVPMTKNACYRVFAVADSSIHDIDIVILKNGAIMGTDDQTQPVAIVQGSSPFCPPDDATYSFDVKIDGDGQGAYTFGIWTRPK
jgi:hypothetical protein